jgi:hypothetical protein
VQTLVNAAEYGAAKLEFHEESVGEMDEMTGVFSPKTLLDFARRSCTVIEPTIYDAPCQRLISILGVGSIISKCVRGGDIGFCSMA